MVRFPRSVIAGLTALGVVAVACGRPATRSWHRISQPGGQTRTWAELDPAGPGRAPLLVVLHGFTSSAQAMATVTGFDTEARRDGFVVAYPEGKDRRWDAGSCCGMASVRGVDDEAFLAAIIGRLTAAGRVDAGRVYLTGFSNGAMLAWRFACDHAALVAGVAVVEGTLTASCPDHLARDLLVIHQRGDDVVPLAGTTSPPMSVGATAAFTPVRDAVARWQDGEACGAGAVVTPATRTVPFEQDILTCAPVRTVLDVIEGGGHTWPHGQGAIVDATSAIATFFKLRH